MTLIASTVDQVEMTNLVGKLLLLLREGVGNFGWTVVVFTIIL